MADSPLTQIVLGSLGVFVSASVAWASWRYRASYFPGAEVLGRRVSFGLALIPIVMACAVVSAVVGMLK